MTTDAPSDNSRIVILRVKHFPVLADEIEATAIFHIARECPIALAFKEQFPHDKFSYAAYTRIATYRIMWKINIVSPDGDPNNDGYRLSNFLEDWKLAKQATDPDQIIRYVPITQVDLSF